MGRALFDKLHQMTFEALATTYIKNDTMRKATVEEMLRLMCDLHILLDEDIEVRIITLF